MVPHVREVVRHLGHGVDGLLAPLLGEALRKVHATLLHHGLELVDVLAIDVLQLVEGDAVGDAVVDVQHLAQAVAEGVAHAHFAVGEAETAHVAGHHQQLVALGIAAFAAQEHLPAHLQALLAVSLGEGVLLGAGDGLHAVDVGVHARVEPLVGGHGGDQVGVQHDLVEDGPVALQAELLHGAREHGGHAHLRTGAADGGHPAVVDAGPLDQVQPLVLHAAALVGEHQGTGLGHVHGAAAADAHDAGGQPAPLQDVVPQAVDQLGGGFIPAVDEDQLIVRTRRDAPDELGLVLEVVVHHEDQEGAPLHVGRGSLVRHPVRLQDLAQLGEGAAAVTGAGDGLEVAEKVHTIG